VSNSRQRIVFRVYAKCCAFASGVRCLESRGHAHVTTFYREPKPLETVGELGVSLELFEVCLWVVMKIQGHGFEIIGGANDCVVDGRTDLMLVSAIQNQPRLLSTTAPTFASVPGEHSVTSLWDGAISTSPTPQQQRVPLLWSIVSCM
jgi:hypothetical protein